MGKYFKKEKKIKPSPISKFYSLGIYYSKNEEYKKAIEFFKKVLIINPDHLDSKNKMRLLIKKLKSKENYLNEKYYNIVDGYLIDKKISVIGGNINFKTWFDLGLYYKEMQMYEQSVASFKNALRIRPNHTDTHFELSSIYDEIENYHEYTTNVYNEEELLNIDNQINDENDKEKHLEESMPQKFNLSELHYRLGWAFGEPKYYPHVLELCKKVIEFEPEFVDVYYWFGWIYEKLKQYADAVFAYNKAILIDENYIFAYNRLGNIYLKQLKFDEAIEIYKESIKNNPENIRAYLKMGSIYNKISQYDKAIEILKKALEIDPQNFFLWNLISKSYRNLGWYCNTKDALKKVIDIKPDYFKAYKSLSNVISNEEAFIIWSKKQGASESAMRLAINDITEISNYALKTNKSKISIFDMLTTNQFNKMYSILFSDTVFKNKNKERHNAYFLAMNKYSKFLKQSKSDVSTYAPTKETDIVNNKRPEENTTVAVTQNLEQPFFKWLIKSKGLTEDTAKNYVSVINNIMDLALQVRATETHIFTISSVAQMSNVTRILFANDKYQQKNSNNQYAYSAVLNSYIRFLSDLSGHSETMAPNVSVLSRPNITLINNIVNFNDKNETYAYTKPYSLEIKGQVFSVSNWSQLLSSLCNYLLRYAPGVLEKYETSRSLDKLCFSWNKDDLRDAKRLMNGLYLETNLSAKDIIRHSRLFCLACGLNLNDVIIKYSVGTDSPNVKESDNNHGESCIPGRKLKTVDEYITNAEIDSSHEQLLINTVLDNSFKNGIKLGSIINIRKFMMAFHDNYPDYKLSDDADILKEKIRRVTIQCPNDLYMTPNTIAKDIALIKDILSYIIDTLKSGKMVIYVENIYNRFKNRLLDTNIYSKDIFESLIKHYLKDDIIYSKGTILSEYGVKLNIDDEVLEVLSGSDTSLNKQEIFVVLHHLTHSKIEHILKSDKRSIYIQRNIYWHIDKFEVTEDDKLLLDDIIRYEIKDGFISLKKLLDVLKMQAQEFIQKNNITNYICLRDILKYYFGDDFGFQYTFIGRKNEEMSGVVATRNFLADKERFKLSELFDFIGENDLPKHYELFIKEASKEFIRINEQDFIKKTDFAISDLDIKNIEEVIQKYLTNGYFAINKIDSFAIFPTIYFQWNSFLLKSIIETYCYGYEIFDFSRSVTKPSGVIVSKMAGYKNFDEILIDVIAEQNKYHPFQSINDAQEYLYENAYIAQKKYKNFEVIFSSAKQKTIQRVRL